MRQNVFYLFGSPNWFFGLAALISFLISFGLTRRIALIAARWLNTANLILWTEKFEEVAQRWFCILLVLSFGIWPILLTPLGGLTLWQGIRYHLWENLLVWYGLAGLLGDLISFWLTQRSMHSREEMVDEL